MFVLSTIPEAYHGFVMAAVCIFLLSNLGLLSILLRRLIQASQMRFHDRLKSQFIRWIIDCVHSDLTHQSKHEMSFKKKLKFFSKGAYTRKIMIEVFRSFTQNLRGPHRQSLINLYEALELDQYTSKNLASSRLRRIIQGLKEVRDFQQDVSEEQYQKLISSPFVEVREEALYVLFEKRGSMFADLMNGSYLLSQWQRILIYNRMVQLPVKERPEIPICHNGVRLKNRLFLIDLIGKLNMQEYYVKLLNMLTNEPTIVRLKVIQALVDLGRTESISFLQKLRKTSEDLLLLQAADQAIDFLGGSGKAPHFIGQESQYSLTG